MTRSLLAVAVTVPVILGAQAPHSPAADSQVAALTKMLASVNAGDAKAYARLYAPDARIIIYGSETLTGRDAIEQHEVGLLREYPGTRLAFYAVWQRGPLAVVHYGVNDKTPAGQGMGHEGLLFFQFNQAGLIQGERRYLDSLTPMAQLGALGAVAARPLPTLPADMETYVATPASGGTTPVALARTLVGAMNAIDEPAFLARVADDAVVDELMDPEVYAGKANVKRWFEKWMGANTAIIDMVGVGDFALVETIVHGSLNGAFGPLHSSTMPVSLHRALVLHVKDGTLVHLAAFMNGKELAQAVGQWPPRGPQPTGHGGRH